MDEAARKRFEKLENEELRLDIIGHLQHRNGEYCFENQPDGRCSMLDEDGLCRIQRQLDERALCNTCRKFPRLTARVGGEIWLSMAASCPVVAAYLWNQKPGWLRQDKNGKKCGIDVWSFLPVREGMVLYQRLCQRIQEKRQQDSCAQEEGLLPAAVREHWHRFALFLDLTDGCLELMKEFPEQPYLEGSFAYFEQEDKEVSEILGDMEAFASAWQKPFLAFVEHYLPYRLFSRFLEFQKEDSCSRFCQVMGELAMIYLILFSRFHTLGITKAGIMETINWVYRFCAHGAALSGKVTEMFRHIFKEPEESVRLFL